METSEFKQKDIEGQIDPQSPNKIFNAFASILKKYPAQKTNEEGDKGDIVYEDDSIERIDKMILMGEEETATNQNNPHLLGQTQEIVEEEDQSDKVEEVMVVPEPAKKRKTIRLSKKSGKNNFFSTIPQEKKDNPQLNTAKLESGDQNELLYQSKVSQMLQEESPSPEKLNNSRLQARKCVPSEFQLLQPEQQVSLPSHPYSSNLKEFVLLPVTPLIIITEDPTLELELKNQKNLITLNSSIIEPLKKVQQLEDVSFAIEVQLMPVLELIIQQRKNTKEKQKQKKSRYVLDQNQQIQDDKALNEVPQGQNQLDKVQRTPVRFRPGDDEIDYKRIKKSGKSIYIPTQDIVIGDTDDERSQKSEIPRSNVCNLSLIEIIKQLQSLGIINSVLYREFFTQHSQADIHQFLKKFKRGKLHKFQFNTYKFTILDHRRLAELLVVMKPKRFYIGSVNQIDPEIQDFLENLYILESEEYCQLYEKIDKISQIKWWNKIMLAQNQKLIERNKQRQLAAKTAEKAAETVEKMISAGLGKIDEEVSREMKEIRMQRIKNPEIVRQYEMKRREDQVELGKIRNMVSKFGKEAEVQPAPTMNMRKKIKFY